MGFLLTRVARYNLGDDDRSTLHKYAREKSESLRVSLKRAREAE